jgi:hypothetical protein
MKMRSEQLGTIDDNVPETDGAVSRKCARRGPGGRAQGVGRFDLGRNKPRTEGAVYGQSEAQAGLHSAGQRVTHTPVGVLGDSLLMNSQSVLYHVCK